MANGFGGFGGFSSPGSNQLTVEQLLSVAKAQGGAVGEVAEELSHPKRSLLSTVGNGFKNAFTGFLDAIAVPSQIVTGIVTPGLSVKEAIEQNVSMSDVIYGDDKRKNLTGMQKFRSFSARLAVDVLTDPLTYVTFGASRGVLGFAQAPKFFAKEVDAKTVLSTLERKGVIGEEAKALVKKGEELADLNDSVFLSEQGENLANRFLDSQRKGTRHTFVKLDRDKILRAFKKAGRDVDVDDIPKLLKEVEEGVHDEIINLTLNARLSKSFAVDTVGKMIQRNPQLIETLVEKGGVKFFGKTILSGQRIKQTLPLLPGMTVLDHTTRKFRNSTKALFSRNYTVHGKLPDEFIQVDQKWRDMADSMNNDLLQKTTRLYKELDISQNEDQFITAAIEAGLQPADPRAGELWKTLHGIMPEGDVIRPEVWKAATFTKQQLSKNLKNLRESGAPVADFANYFPHMLVKQEVKSIGFRLPPKQVAQAGKFASISAFVGEEGQRIVGKATKIGEGGLEVIDPQGKKLLLEAQEGGGYLDENFLQYSRERATILEAKEFGVDFADSALATMLLSSMDATKVSVSRNFVKEVGEKMGQTADKAPSFYRPVNVTGLKYEGQEISTFFTGKNGKPIVFHPDVAERIEKFSGSMAADEATENILKQYDKLQNLFKATVTSIFPAFHGRNAISNVMLNFLDMGYHALQPKYNVMAASAIKREASLGKLHAKMFSADPEKAAKAAKEYGDTMREIVFRDKTGYQWSAGELRSVIKNNVVAFHPRNLGQIDQVQFGRDSVDDVAEKLFPTSKGDKIKVNFQKVNPLSTKNELIKTGLKVGSLVEDQSRLVNFFGNLDKSGDPLLAAEHVKSFLFDYQNLSNFERTFLRRIIPFYCVPEDTEALTRDGWKKHSDINDKDELLTYNKDSDEYEWQVPEEIFVAPFDDYMTNLKSKRYSLSATFNHRWVVEDYKKDIIIKRGYELNTGDKIKTTSKYLGTESKWTKEDARLLGWLLTDGSFRWRGNHCEAVIYQSPKKFLDEVIEVAGGNPRKPHPDTGVVCVPVLLERINRIKHLFKRDKKGEGWIDFVTSLGREEMEAMYDAMYKADGTTSLARTQDTFACELRGVGETFQVLATLLGKRAIKGTKAYTVSSWNKLGVKDMWKEHYLYKGNVWCPRTKNGTWVMRQNGFVTISGNTFSRKNLERQVKTLFTRPGAIAGEIRAVQTIGDALGAGDLSEEERAALPQWMQDGINTVLSREGSHVTLLSTIGSPIEQPFQQFQPNQFMASISPIVRVPFELMSGYSFFHGKMLSEVTNAAAYKSAPPAIKDFIGFTEVNGSNKAGEKFTYYAALRPERMHLVNNLPPTTRILSTIKQLQKPGVDAQTKIWQQLIGFNPHDFDLELEAKRREDELRKELEGVLDTANVGFSFSRFVLPKD